MYITVRNTDHTLLTTYKRSICKIYKTVK